MRALRQFSLFQNDRTIPRLDDADGASSLEFALLAPALTLLIIGSINLANLSWQAMEVRQAAQAGAQYALKTGWSASAITSAASSATNLSVTVTPTQFNGCVVNGAVQSTSATSCSDGSTPGTYVKVEASAPAEAFITWSQITLPSTVSATALVRIG